MDLGHPHTILGETVEADVLLTLSRTTKPLTGRAVARISGRSQGQVAKILNRLAVEGLVHADPADPAILFSLNRDHLAAPAVLLITGLRKALIDKIREQVKGWPIEPVHVSVFGSAARGDGDTSSDVDIFIVRPRRVQEDDEGWRKQLDELGRSIHRVSGNHAGISEIGEREIAGLRRERPPVVASLQQDAITIQGDEPAQLFGRTTR